MTPAVKDLVRTDLVAGTIRQGDYRQACRQISDALAGLHASIPDERRLSCGIVYTIKVLSEYLYAELERQHAPVCSVAGAIYEASEESRPKCVALALLSFYGLGDLAPVLGHFEAAAASADWEMREIAQMLFRRLIAKHPDAVRGFLVRLTRSSDPNLRRFVAETLRPVQENRWFYRDPAYPLSILEPLFNESSRYPRTSVGNNLSDLSRRLPDLVYGLVDELVKSGDVNSYWIAYRACRNLVKADPVRVLDLLGVDEYRYKKRRHLRLENRRD